MRLKPRTPLTHALELVVLPIEETIKKIVFDCRMCGQCVLHSTGLTCPMRCPKNLRNGPCGGVRANGNCEVFADKSCVWVKAIEGSRQIPFWGDHIHHLMPPVNWQLQGTASWINLITGEDQMRPNGWNALNE